MKLSQGSIDLDLLFHQFSTDVLYALYRYLSYNVINAFIQCGVFLQVLDALDLYSLLRLV